MEMYSSLYRDKNEQIAMPSKDIVNNARQAK